MIALMFCLMFSNGTLQWWHSMCLIFVTTRWKPPAASKQSTSRVAAFDDQAALSMPRLV